MVLALSVLLTLDTRYGERTDISLEAHSRAGRCQIRTARFPTLLAAIKSSKNAIWGETPRKHPGRLLLDCSTSEPVECLHEVRPLDVLQTEICAASSHLHVIGNSKICTV